ncbi:MAG TPA: TIGR01777 family oxidoreductase [Candidatus Dormibacteraeota bacterium]|nr:TIGR01777 family oxidoreductase [Candidatus Dormibacteraeota bacterium]
MKVVVAGGTGYIGSALLRALHQAGHETVVLTRRPPQAVSGLPSSARAVRWDATTSDARLTAALEGAGAVVNLAGSNIGAWPWTPGRRAEILESRVQATRALVSSLREGGAPRPALINASGIDYYGDRGEEVIDEESAPGTSFLARVCAQWEEAAREAERLGCRVVMMRTGLVLSRDSPTLRLLALPFRLFVGGPAGSGRQWVSWVHLDDVVGLYLLAIEDVTLSGPVNVVAPDPRRNAELAAELGRVLGRPSWLPVPASVLRLVLGEQADLLLHGRRVEPKVALARGYAFRRPSLADALRVSLPG